MSRWIVREFERPSAELVMQFKDVPTSILSDSMARFQAMEGGIRPIATGMRLLGVAFTVCAVETSNWEAHQALRLAQAGDVLVIAARGSMQGAVWGYVMTYAAQQRALAGVVIDGCIRDMEENRASGLPIYCRGAAPAGPHKGWQGHINVPVACAGVPVMAGDIVVGDEDGVVVVPRLRAEEVLEEARQRLKQEAEWLRRIESGESTADILGLGDA